MKQTVAVVSLSLLTALAVAGPQEDQLRDEVSLPPLGQGPWAVKLDFTSTPMGGKYADPGVPVAEFRKAVRDARILLWASSSGTPPREIQSEVAAIRKTMVVPVVAMGKGRPIVGKGGKGMGSTPLLRSSYLAPGNPAQEKQMKEGLVATNREVARLISRLEQAQEELERLYEMRARECLRWQAHHALTSAAISLRICHLNEYALALGQMRKEFPDRDPSKHKGWRLEPAEAMQDPASKKILRATIKQLEEISKSHPGTVWDQTAAGLVKTPLSITWVAE
jgi:hypothetical protein